MSALDGITDPHERLRVSARLVRDAEAHLRRCRAERLAAAGDLRDAGVAMATIATAAGVTDSYLTRKLLENGASRRYGTTRL